MRLSQAVRHGTLTPVCVGPNPTEDGFCSYFESTACEDKNYDEIVKDVLDSLRLKWERVTKISERRASK